MTVQRIENAIRRPPPDHRDRPPGQAGRRLRPRPVRRHVVLAAVTVSPNSLHPPVLPAHGRVPREDLRRGQDSRRVPQARRPALGQGDPGGPAHRPLDPAALPRGLQERSPGLRHGALGRPGERRRRARRAGRVGRAQPVAGPVERADRRGARRPGRGQLDSQPDLPAARVLRPSTSSSAAPPTRSSWSRAARSRCPRPRSWRRSRWRRRASRS